VSKLFRVKLLKKEAPYLSFRSATRGTQEEGSEAPTSPGPVSRHLIPSALTVLTEATFPSSHRESSHLRRQFSFRRASGRRSAAIVYPARVATVCATCITRVHVCGHASTRTHVLSPFLSLFLTLSADFSQKRSNYHQTLSFVDLDSRKDRANGRNPVSFKSLRQTVSRARENNTA